LARAFGIGLVERLRLPDLLPALRHLLADPHELVRDRAIEAVAVMQDHESVPRLVELLEQDDDDVALLCLESLAQLDGRAAIGAVSPLLNHDDLDICHAALTCLDVFDDPGEARQVRPLLSSTNPRLRERARSLLSRWEKYGGAEVSLSQQEAIEQLLTWAVEVDADTLILAGGAVPLAKKATQSARFGDAPLSAEFVQQMVLPLLTSFQRERLFEQEDVNFTWVHGGDARFRVAVFGQEKGLTAVFQRSRTSLRPLSSLGLPQGLLPLLDQRNGLVLICGGPGSGKSTALHGLIEHLNTTKTRHIVTLEGAIEVVHQNKRSIITQRELGTHALELSSALRAALREDPDILVFDDVREEEALRFALSAAETGHLVIATLQTGSCQTAIDRVLDAFPQSQREHACAMLASSLHGVMCLNLLQRLDGAGHVPATELLLNSAAVANAIRRGKTLQLASILATSVELGMQPMRADIDRLVRAGLIARPEES
jgi:twitching motility protein PilT